MTNQPPREFKTYFVPEDILNPAWASSAYVMPRQIELVEAGPVLEKIKRLEAEYRSLRLEIEYRSLDFQKAVEALRVIAVHGPDHTWDGIVAQLQSEVALKTLAELGEKE